MKRKAVIFDIDGTLVETRFLLNEIWQKGLKGEAEWEYFYEHCNSKRVKLIPSVEKLYKFLRYNTTCEFACILCTARNEVCRQRTLTRLAELGIFCDGIYMRGKDDLRDDAEVKRDLFAEIQKKYDVIMVIDDDWRNCEVAKELGLLALRVVQKA